MRKLWGGRFEGTTNRQVEWFTASLEVDARLWEADLATSRAHARMLGEVGVLSGEEARVIVQALETLGREIHEGNPEAPDNAEDIHSEIERLLDEKIGPLAGKLHTARSRNDQVATATRLYLRSELDGLSRQVADLQRWLVGTAERHLTSIMPGLTHLQHAQPVSLAHHLMAYFWMLQRDRERLVECRKRVNALPLGAAALAGTSFPINRQMVAHELGFESLCENSLDAVSDRDFAVEFLSAAALVMTHLSRLAEEIILWNTPELGFVTLSDEVSTGSSIMPQKKNPDVAELIRGRTGRVHGALIGTLTMLKGLPLSYNRDLQEDKVHLFAGLDTVRACVGLCQVMLERLDFHPERMAQAVKGDFSNATDLADYLAGKGMPFREAHEIAGKIVRHCLANRTSIEELSVECLTAFSSLFEIDIIDKLKPAAVLGARRSVGGTAPGAVAAQLARAKELMS